MSTHNTNIRRAYYTYGNNTHKKRKRRILGAIGFAKNIYSYNTHGFVLVRGLDLRNRNVFNSARRGLRQGFAHASVLPAIRAGNARSVRRFKNASVGTVGKDMLASPNQNRQIFGNGIVPYSVRHPCGASRVGG